MKAHALLGGGAFLPVHWGTFSLAMHAWDEPVETLLKLAPKYDATFDAEAGSGRGACAG